MENNIPKVLFYVDLYEFCKLKVLFNILIYSWILGGNEIYISLISTLLKFLFRWRLALCGIFSIILTRKRNKLCNFHKTNKVFFYVFEIPISSKYLTMNPIRYRTQVLLHNFSCFKPIKTDFFIYFFDHTCFTYSVFLSWVSKIIDLLNCLLEVPQCLAQCFNFLII